MLYAPPTPEDIERLKKSLDKDGNQMAELFGVHGNRAFRRYTSKSSIEKNRREIGAYMLFFAAARLELKPVDIERILARMREIGATIDLTAASDSLEQAGE